MCLQAEPGRARKLSATTPEPTISESTTMARIARDCGDDDKRSIAIDQREHRKGRSPPPAPCGTEGSGSRRSARGGSRQAPISRVAVGPVKPRQARLENPFDPRFKPVHFRRSAGQLLLGDSAPVDPRREPGACAAERHLRRDDHQRHGEERARARRQRRQLIAAKMSSSPPQAREWSCAARLRESEPVGTVRPRYSASRSESGQRPLRNGWSRVHRVRLASRARPTAALARARTGAAISLARSAPAPRIRSSSARILAKLLEPLADRRNERDERFGKRRLERAKALAGKRAEHLLDALAGDRGINSDEVLRFGAALQIAGSAGRGSGSVFALRIFCVIIVVAVGQVDPAHVRRVGLRHFRACRREGS